MTGHAIRHNPLWTLALPVIGAAILGLALLAPGMPGLLVLVSLGLVGCVIAAVHHAEVIAHRVGEPFGTLVLAMAVTVIEVSLIVSMMLSGGEATATLARDTVFAAVMLILNGIIGISLMAGARRHFEQGFHIQGVTAGLATLTSILVLTLVLPNYATSTKGASYADSQLMFVAIATLVLFGGFTFMQTVRHRDYFLPEDESGEDNPHEHADPPTNAETSTSLVMLVLALVAVVLSAKKISPTMEALLDAAGAPPATLGILIAAIVLLPEGVAAMRAAVHNRLQTSLNLAVGSAIASMGLTVPVVAVVALVLGWPLMLGLDGKSTVLLLLTLFVASISLRTGRTNIQLGLVHLVLLMAYLFMSVVP